MPRKRGHEDDEDLVEDEMEEDDDEVEDDEDEEEDDDDDDDDTIDLDQAEEEEKEDEDDDDDDEDGESVDKVERRRLFQNEAEDLLDNMSLEEVREVLRENDLDESQAQRLRKILAEVVDEGEVASMDEAWEEAIERLEEE